MPLRFLFPLLCLAALLVTACDNESRADRAEARAAAAEAEFHQQMENGAIPPDRIFNRLKHVAELAAEARTARDAANASAASPDPELTPAAPRPSTLEAARVEANARAHDLERLYSDLTVTLRRLAHAAPPERTQLASAEIATLQAEAIRILSPIRRFIASDQIDTVISARDRATQLAPPLRLQLTAARERLQQIQPKR